MFSDRLWVAKLAAVLALLGWFVRDTRQRVLREHPAVEQVALAYDRVGDRDIHISPREVVSADATGFVVDTKVGPMRITTPTPPRAGQTITAVARATGPRTLRAVALQINEGQEWKRPLNYAISILTVLVYLWVIRSRFRWRIEDGVFRSRY